MRTRSQTKSKTKRSSTSSKTESNGERAGLSASETDPINISVTYPTETYYPIKFNGFEIGGLTLSAGVPPGQTVESVHDRLWGELKYLAAKEYEDKLALYLERIERAGKVIEDRAFKV